MNFSFSLSLLQTFVIFLSIVTSLHKVECKTTLSKLQYINAIRDVIEGLIKSLATRQKIEMNRRLELHEYRKHHEHRLGKDILVCRLCKEIFVDPDKYFDHAHFHVVEKLKLIRTTDSNLRCQLCEDSFVNQFDLYKHCYENHLLNNLDRLTTKAPETTTTKPNYAEDLYCKICNITLMYPERFYVHSFQHLLDNMDLILNTTVHRNTEKGTEKTLEDGISGLEKHEHRAPQEDTTICNYKYEYCKRGNPSSTDSSKKATMHKSPKKFENLDDTKIELLQIRSNRTFTKTKRINKTYNTTVAFEKSDSNRIQKNSSKIRNFGNLSYTEQKIWKFNNPKRFLNMTDERLKELILQDLHISINKTNGSLQQSKSQNSKISTQTRVTFEPKMVQHLQKAAHWFQQKERKRDPDTKLVVIARLDKKAYMQHLLTKQQRKLVSLEQYLDRNSSDIYRYVVVNNSIVDRTRPAHITFPPERQRNTLPLCFITEPTRLRYTSRSLKYTNFSYMRNFRPRLYTSTYYFNRNLYKNVNYTNKVYKNILNATNLIDSNTTRTMCPRESYYKQYPKKFYSLNDTVSRRWAVVTKFQVKDNTTKYFNKNLYKNRYLANNYVPTRNSTLKYINGTITNNTRRRINQRTLYDIYTVIKNFTRSRNQTKSRNHYTTTIYSNKNLYLNMPFSKNISEIEWNFFCTKSQKYYTRTYVLCNRNLYKYQNTTSQNIKNPSDKLTNARRYEQNTSVTLKRRKRNMIYHALDNILKEDAAIDDSNAKRNPFHHQLDECRYHENHKRAKRQVRTTNPALNELNLKKHNASDNNKHNTHGQHFKTELENTLPIGSTTGWTNLYYTASRMIERIFQTHVRIVRITKDLRTTKKITLKPYPGAEEFTGDSFQGESGENRYERLLKKMRSTQIYLKCPFCPLRFYYNPELMSHINVQHNGSGTYNETTFDVLFKTFPPDQTKHWNLSSVENFAENFPTFDYEYPTRPPERPAPTQSTQTTKTTIDLNVFSKMMENFMKPDYLKGFLTTAGSTRNIDYLHRARTYATTKPHLSQVEGALKDARDYLRKLAATMLESEEYQEIATTQPIVRSNIRKEATRSEMEQKPTEENIEEIKRSQETTQGLIIEEVTTGETTLSKKEVLQMGMKVLEEQMQFLKNKDILSTVVHKVESTTFNRSIRTFRYTERFRIFKGKFGEQNRTMNRILEQIQSGLATSPTERSGGFRNNQPLRTPENVSMKSEVTGETTSISDKYVPKRIRKRTTVAYAPLYGTEINVTEDEHINKMLEILRRTRPVENYYRYVFDYKRRLGPTEMSYEDSDANKRNSTTVSTFDQKPPTVNFANFIASLKSLKTSPSTNDLSTPSQPDYAKFLRKLADLKAEEKRRREKAKADYDEQLKQMEAKVSEKSTPLFINVNDMMKYRCEDEERNKKVADTFKFILKNDIRETYWNATKDQVNVTETYDDGYGDLDYETMTQYVYDPRDQRVFQNVPPTKTSKFVTHIPTAVKKSKSTAPPKQNLF